MSQNQYEPNRLQWKTINLYFDVLRKVCLKTDKQQNTAAELAFFNNMKGIKTPNVQNTQNFEREPLRLLLQDSETYIKLVKYQEREKLKINDQTINFDPDEKILTEQEETQAYIYTFLINIIGEYETRRNIINKSLDESTTQSLRQLAFKHQLKNYGFALMVVGVMVS